MRYFNQEDFNKCVEFLKGKPETVETQQELHKFMHEECRMIPCWKQITIKDLTVYSKVYETRNNPEHANWCATMRDGSQVVWNRKCQEFFRLGEIGIERCGYINYSDLFVEIKDIDTWLLDHWSDWRFVEMQKQLVAICNGKYNQFFHNY